MPGWVNLLPVDSRRSRDLETRYPFRAKLVRKRHPSDITSALLAMTSHDVLIRARLRRLEILTEVALHYQLALLLQLHPDGADHLRHADLLVLAGGQVS